MSWVLEIGVIPANITNVTIDRKPIASGELVTCGDQLVIGWRTPVGEQAGYGTLAAGAGAGAPPVLTWDGHVVVPVPVTPRGQIPRPLESRYRRRDTEVLRWQLPAANQSSNRWLIHPGAMTGDLWHIATAMTIDQNLNLVSVWNRDNETDNRNANALLNLVTGLGIDRKRIVRTTSGLGPNQSLGNDQARADGAKRVDTGVQTPLVGHTWASTSVVITQALQGGYTRARVQAAQTALTTAFTNACTASESFQQYKAAFDAYCLGWLAGLAHNTHYLLVNMRWVGRNGQNPQHNITQGRYNQILARANAATNPARPIQLIKIGRPDVRAPGDCGWTVGALGVGAAAPALAVDIYADDPAAPPGLSDAIWKNKLFQAYFWMKVAEKEASGVGIRFHLIGGRSGGLDIASFLGLRSASWDRPGGNDQHYMRLHWAAPYNSIIRDTVDERLDEGALDYWLRDGNLVPIIEGEPTTGSVIGTLDEYKGDKARYEALWFPPYP